MSDPIIISEIKNDIAYVTLNRPEKLNAINMAMFHEIDKVTKSLAKNKKIRAVIVKANGTDFCSGLDINSVLKSSKNAIKLLFKWLPGQSNLAQRVSTAWRKIPVPVIMVLHGRVWGGGLQIAMGADFRIATPTAEFSIMESKWGMIPDMGGTLEFKEQLSLDEAKLLAMTAEIFDAERALSLKLITKIADEPLKEAESLISTLVKQSPDSVAGVKKLYNKAWWRTERFALAMESIYQIKIIFGKNQRIKSYNQTHSSEQQKSFKPRQRW